MSRRHGNLLALALIVLVLMGVVVGAFQYLFVQSVSLTHATLDAGDSLARADGILAFLISRFKKEFRYHDSAPLTSPPSGSEAGVWDSRRFVAGWMWEKLPWVDPRYRAVVWVRFPEIKPALTWRYELELRLPAVLEPRLVRVVSFAPDQTDPADSGQRAESFALPALGNAPRVDAAIDASVLALEPVVRRPVAEVAALPRTPDPARVEAVALVHEAHREVRSCVGTAQVDAARRMVERARVVERRFEERAGLELADALVRRGELSPRAVRDRDFAEADRVLRDLLAGCCSRVRVAWRLAILTMRRRADLASPGVLAAARSAGRAILDAVVTVPPAFVGPDVDIKNDEPPELFDALWRSRVAASIAVDGGRYLLASVREDGTGALLHMESAAPVEPLAWQNDGAGIFVAGLGKPDDESIWRFHFDGSPVQNFWPPAAPGGFAHIWARTQAIEELPGTGAVIVEGNNDRRFEGIGLAAGSAIATPDKRVMSNRQYPEAHMYTGAVVSPDERWAAIKGRSGTKQGFGLFPLDRFLDAAFETTTDLNTNIHGSAPGYPVPLVNTRFPATGERYAGAGWKSFGGQEWIGLTVLEDTGTHVELFPITRSPEPQAGPPVVLATVPGVNPDPETKPDMARAGAFVSAPAGYLVAGKDAVYFHRFPPDPTVTPPAWPIGLAGTLSEVGQLASPPWGGVAFLVAREGGARKLFRMDLTSGASAVLVGPGGAIPRASEAWRLAVSPVPEPAP